MGNRRRGDNGLAHAGQHAQIVWLGQNWEATTVWDPDCFSKSVQIYVVLASEIEHRYLPWMAQD